MKKIITAVAAVAACAAAQAQTESPFYVELGYTGTKFENPVASADPGMVRAIFGWEATPYLAVEAMGAFSEHESEARVGGSKVDVEIEHSWGLYLKPKMKFGDAVEVFGRLGFTESRVKVSAEDGSDSDSGNDFTYGVGLNYAISKTAYASIDYLNYYNKDSVKIKGFTIAIGTKF